jgi:hypothetical protein
VLRTSRYDTVLRVTRYVAIHAPGLTILLSLPNYYIMTYCITLGYTTTISCGNLLLINVADARCEHTSILRALVKYSTEHPGGTWRLSGPQGPDVRHRTLPSIQHQALHSDQIVLHDISVTPRDISCAT